MLFSDCGSNMAFVTVDVCLPVRARCRARHVPDPGPLTPHRKETDGVSTNGVIAFVVFFDRDFFGYSH